MRKSLLSVALVPFVVSMAAAQGSSHTSDAKAVWKGVIVNLTSAADEISEAMYSYRPTPEVRTFGEMFAHVAGSQKMFCAMALGDKVPGEADVEKSAKTKAAIVAALKESNTYCERAYAQSDDAVKAKVDIFGQSQTRYYALVMNATHDGEHYGNIVTYMRMNKLVPPSSRRQ
jgi:uncharacterized damage-inducible protein DinB